MKLPMTDFLQMLQVGLRGLVDSFQLLDFTARHGDVFVPIGPKPIVISRVK